MTTSDFFLPSQSLVNIIEEVEMIWELGASCSCYGKLAVMRSRSTEKMYR